MRNSITFPNARPVLCAWGPKCVSLQTPAHVASALRRSQANSGHEHTDTAIPTTDKACARQQILPRRSFPRDKRSVSNHNFKFTGANNSLKIYCQKYKESQANSKPQIFKYSRELTEYARLKCIFIRPEGAGAAGTPTSGAGSPVGTREGFWRRGGGGRGGGVSRLPGEKQVVQEGGWLEGEAPESREQKGASTGGVRLGAAWGGPCAAASGENWNPTRQGLLPAPLPGDTAPPRCGSPGSSAWRRGAPGPPQAGQSGTPAPKGAPRAEKGALLRAPGVPPPRRPAQRPAPHVPLPLAPRALRPVPRPPPHIPVPPFSLCLAHRTPPSATPCSPGPAPPRAPAQPCSRRPLLAPLFPGKGSPSLRDRESAVTRCFQPPD